MLHVLFKLLVSYMQPALSGSNRLQVIKLIEAVEALKAELDIPPTIKEILAKTRGVKQV